MHIMCSNTHDHGNEDEELKVHWYLVLYPACFNKMAAALWKVAWETKSMLPTQCHFVPKIRTSDQIIINYDAVLDW